MTTTDDSAAIARANAERRQRIEERLHLEGDIRELRRAAVDLRSLAAGIGDPLDQALRFDGPDTWMGRKAEEFRGRINPVRDDLVGAKMTSVHFELENAALHCELRASSIESTLPVIPPIAVPRMTG